jgi:hypothetical protein
VRRPLGLFFLLFFLYKKEYTRVQSSGYEKKSKKELLVAGYRRKPDTAGHLIGTVRRKSPADGGEATVG